MTTAEPGNFTRLRQEILDRSGHSSNQVAGQFHVWEFDPQTDPRAQMDLLKSRQALAPAQCPVINCGGGTGGETGGQVPEGTP